MNKFCVVTIMKNEGLYADEWFQFYKLQGVDRFIFFNNESSDNTADIARYHGAHVIEWPGRSYDGYSVQRAAYNLAIKNYAHECEWMAFLDCDEFLYCKSGAHLPTAFAFFPPTVGIVAVHWYLFGSNGHLERTPGKVIERFTRRGATPNPHIKSVCRGSMLMESGPNAHVFRSTGDTINERGRILAPYPDYALEEGGTADYLAINHYHTKSKAEYLIRCNKGRVDLKTPRDFDVNFPHHDQNDVVDTYLRDTFAGMIG